MSIAKNVGDSVRQLVKAVSADVFLFGGAAAVVWGVHFWSVPAAWVTGGVMAVAIGIYGLAE